MIKASEGGYNKMNVKELNNDVRNNQKKELEKKIEEIEEGIIWRADNSFNNFEVNTYVYDDVPFYTISKWMLEPLRDYFIDEGYRVEIKETKDPIKWIGKLLRVCEPEYSMIISW